MIGRYIGIDQSFSGFAVVAYAPGEAPAVHRKAFPPAKFGKGVGRLIAVQEWLDELFGRWGGIHPPASVMHIAMEGYARGRAFRREEVGEISAAVRLRLLSYYTSQAGYPTIVSPSELKQYATGKGNADKKKVMKFCKEKWGFVTKNDNEADAYVLARMACDLHRGRSDLPEEFKVIQGLTKHTDLPAHWKSSIPVPAL
ncbi:crossover junction endodeoxyribonuclease RuvC [Herbidospora galbida]|uniref:Crossover junction endodeoxyribonuclease RuvC n=1 Tax=Herbidospora galbida TaxID=2575442 RepID=A0A4U3M6U7_9ACTN|nr:crossover junction endodeoxyribonuclease RuvC [Herbidospora galbida]TKK84655.1 crossover junction endodeoxyribonuclease RuvC [Herbidospora galbida]